MGRHRRGAKREVTVADLIDELRRFDPRMEVRLAMQPRMPQEHTVGAVTEADGMVWIGDGGRLGYAPDEVGDRLGWT
ncbi:hypothetical protein F8568_038975 [Actinomadura sp. LD22]|uniref:Uncharacterized protein n=1 Tax=Actinomadura physcomitrii TaxID=2650748 RepID=A0A6I4MKV6_9ACTN|nr:hypothetical protein [Actinomadura physcomitrii]MWA06233.1 hypothetical protein [Actinomadura physcomitrii]